MYSVCYICIKILFTTILDHHTTPQIHYIVCTSNDPFIGEPLNYVIRFAEAYKKFLEVVISLANNILF